MADQKHDLFKGGPVPIPFERPVRVKIPAKAAYDLDAMQNVLGNLAERLGCPQCLSGASCYFELERDFVADLEGRLEGFDPPGGR